MWMGVVTAVQTTPRIQIVWVSSYKEVIKKNLVDRFWKYCRGVVWRSKLYGLDCSAALLIISFIAGSLHRPLKRFSLWVSIVGGNLMPAFLLDLVLVDRLTGEVQTHKKTWWWSFFLSRPRFSRCHQWHRLKCGRPWRTWTWLRTRTWLGICGEIFQKSFSHVLWSVILEETLRWKWTFRLLQTTLEFLQYPFPYSGVRFIFKLKAY